MGHEHVMPNDQFRSLYGFFLLFPSLAFVRGKHLGNCCRTQCMVLFIFTVGFSFLFNFGLIS